MSHEPSVAAQPPADIVKSKRQVNYNQDAVLCPACKKRIRLNNSGRLRVHMAGKVGSSHCQNSNAFMTKDGKILTEELVKKLAQEAVDGYDPDQLVAVARKNIFSDPE